MKILSLSEAEALKNVLYPGDGWSIWEQRARYLTEVRLLYKKGFSICVGENVLWDNTKEMMKDLTGEA